MKKSSLLRSGSLAFAGAAALALTSCGDYAPGLGKDTKAEASGENIYEKTGTVSAPSDSAAAAEAPAKAPTPPPVTPPVAAPPVEATPPAAPTETPAAPPEPAPPTPPTPPAPAAEAPPAAPTPPPPAAATESGPKMNIKPDMPKPLFVGTPLPSTNAPPNLDKSGKPILEVSVPEGVALLSAGKEVTSSDSAPIGELSLVTDGDKDGDDGYFVDLMPGKVWLQVDLGESKDIWLIWVWHFHKQNVIFNDVVAQVSDDPEFKAGVTTVFNNDFDNSAGFGVGTDMSYIETNNGRAMPVNGVKGRYVRLWSAGRDLDDTNQYIEVEVYGK